MRRNMVWCIPNIYTAYLLGKFGRKNQHCQFALKFGTLTNSSIHDSMVVFIFFCFRPEIRFLDKFGPKKQNCQFKLKFGTKTNSNMWISMVMFSFSVSDRKYPFVANLVKKIKIFSLN